MRLSAIRRDDLAAERFEFREHVGQWHQVEVARLAVGHPPLAEERAERAVGVRDFDEEVSAGTQHGQRGAQFLARVGGVLQVVEHADDVVAGAQPFGDLRVGEPAAVRLLHPSGGPRLVDAPGGVEPVEGGVRVDLLGHRGEVSVPGADVEPALRFEVGQHRAGGGQMAAVSGAGGEDPLGEAVVCVRLEVGVVVPVVEGHSLGRQPGVLEGVGAVPALVDDEGAGFALPQVRCAEPGAQPLRAAPGAVVPARFVEPVGALGEFTQPGGAAFGGRLRGGGHGCSCCSCVLLWGTKSRTKAVRQSDTKGT